MRTGYKLAMGAVIICAVTGYLAFVGAETSWQYYVTVDECLAEQEDFADARLRIRGKIRPESLVITQDRSQVQFDLQGSERSLHVVCRGPLPDNLTDQSEVVVEGRLSGDCHLAGERVMTQCASKYESGKAGMQPNGLKTAAREGTVQ
ncbi:MAG: cytochrome c maturation protein CcmE [Planctomycetaceae bacterium]|nr:cytochrome c maturation protein CcmE [Planctomycetaceae bacterium]